MPHSAVCAKLHNNVIVGRGQKSCWAAPLEKYTTLYGSEYGIIYYLELQAIWKVYKALTGVFVLVPLHCSTKSDRWYLNRFFKNINRRGSVIFWLMFSVYLLK